MIRWSARWVVAAGLFATLAACGSSNDSKTVPGSGGDANDGNGNGSGKGSGAEAGKNGGAPSAGDFGSIWRRKSAEYTVLDTASPTLSEMGHLDVPQKVTHPEYEVDVEIFEQIKDDQLVVYAHFDDAKVYYRATYAATRADDSYILTGQTQEGTNVFTLEDGALKLSQTQVLTPIVLLTSTTTYQAYSDPFPPADWPSEMVELAGEGELP